MIYARLQADYFIDDKVLAAGPLAELVYVRAISYCVGRLNDGKIAHSALELIGRGIDDPSRQADALVAAGLWLRNGDGHRFPPKVWRKYQRTAAEVSQERDAAAERQRQYRNRHKQGEDTSTVTAVSQRDSSVTSQGDNSVTRGREPARRPARSTPEATGTKAPTELIERDGYVFLSPPESVGAHREGTR